MDSGMLILTRKVGESLIIGDDVKVTVLGINGKQVKLGTSAPRNVSVHRDEIYRKIKSQPKNDVLEYGEMISAYVDAGMTDYDDMSDADAEAIAWAYLTSDNNRDDALSDIISALELAPESAGHSFAAGDMRSFMMHIRRALPDVYASNGFPGTCVIQRDLDDEFGRRSAGTSCVVHDEEMLDRRDRAADAGGAS